MTTSQEHQRLANAVDKLRRTLLPIKFDPTGTYPNPDEEHLRAISFRVLAHAEIESYLEAIAEGLLDVAWKAWMAHSVPSTTAVALLAFSGREHAEPPSAISIQNASLDAMQCMQKAQAVWRSALGKNHGIKEANVLRLFLPLGIRAQEIDPTLLADLESYGVERGAVAHSSTTKIVQCLDPEAEYKKAVQLVEGLRSLDTIVIKLHRQLATISLALVPSSGASFAPVMMMRNRFKQLRQSRFARR